jgi:thioredoxin reductase (NADPH)
MLTMSEQRIYDIAIIGAGAAGQMGALRSILNNKTTIVFLGDASTNKKSRATWVSKVVNMPFTFELKRPISAATKETFEWIKNESEFADNFTELKAAVVKLEKLSDTFSLTTTTGESYKAKFVLLATGIMDIQPEISGSIKPVLPFANNGHVDYCIRCDGHKSKNKITATIGHTSTAAFVAALLYERYQPPEVKIFTNGAAPDFSEEALSLIELYKIKVVREAIVAIKGDPKTKMEAFELAVSENETRTEAVELAFAMLGQIAYNELAKQVNADINSRGNVICNAKGESSVAGLYVAGDLRDTGKYQIYTAWDQAVDSIDDMDSKLRMQFREECRKSLASI